LYYVYCLFLYSMYFNYSKTPIFLFFSLQKKKQL